MREQPSGAPPSMGAVDMLIRGGVLLALGIFSEISSRPIVPWTYVPGTVLISAGAGIALGVFSRRQPKWSAVLSVVLAVALFVIAFFAQTSFLPPLLFMSAFFLTKWVLTLEIEL